MENTVCECVNMGLSDGVIITSIICVAAFMIVAVLALFTDLFNKN